jgi:hypothetical protein
MNLALLVVLKYLVSIFAKLPFKNMVKYQFDPKIDLFSKIIVLMDWIRFQLACGLY